MGPERERAKAGGYKANWLLEDLEAQNREVIGELETMLNVGWTRRKYTALWGG